MARIGFSIKLTTGNNTVSQISGKIEPCPPARLLAI